MTIIQKGGKNEQVQRLQVCLLGFWLCGLDASAGAMEGRERESMKIMIEVPDETDEIIVDCFDHCECQIAWEIIDRKDFEIIEGDKK